MAWMQQEMPLHRGVDVTANRMFYRVLGRVAIILNDCYLLRRYDSIWDYLIFYWSLILAAITYVQSLPLLIGSEPLLFCLTKGLGTLLLAGALPFISIMLMNIRYEFDLLRITHGTNVVSRFLLVSLCIIDNYALTATLYNEVFKCSN